MLEFIINFTITSGTACIFNKINRRFDYSTYFVGILVGMIQICITHLLNK